MKPSRPTQMPLHSWSASRAMTIAGEERSGLADAF